MAYRSTLSQELLAVHDIFYTSTLKNHLHDPSNVIKCQSVDLQKDLRYEESLVEILERKVHLLRNEEVPLVKVR